MQVTRIRPEAADVDPAAASYLRFLTLTQPELVVYAAGDGILAVGPDGSAVLGPKTGRTIDASTGAALAAAPLLPFAFAMGPQEAMRGFVGDSGWKRVGLSQEMIFRGPPNLRSPVVGSSPVVRAPTASPDPPLSPPFDAWMEAFVRELFTGPMRPPPVLAHHLWTMWDAGAPVSMAGALGRGDDAIRIVTVYTPPALRGRGYAAALVAAMAKAAIERGVRYVTLDYSLEAHESPRTAYERAGFVPTVITERWSRA